MKSDSELNSSNRANSIEMARIASAFAIVWYHGQLEGRAVTYAGLVAFIMFTFFFSCGKNLHRPVKMADLALRLLVPWAAWWLLFAMINLARHKPVVDLKGGVMAGILAGPSVHLWYLPFAFLSLVAMDGLKRWLSTQQLALGIAAASIAFLLAVPIWRPASFHWGPPWAQYAHALIPVALGALIGLSRYGWTERLSLAAVVLVLVAGPALAYEYVGLSYLIGLLVVTVAVSLSHWRPLAVLDLTPWSGAMLGVYLFHPLVLSLLRPITDRVAAVGIILAFTISFAVVVFVRRAAPRFSKLIIG